MNGIGFVKQHKLMIHTVMLVTFASMVFVYPFDNQFRFTLGVVVLSTLLLYLSELAPLRLIMTCGVSIVAFRVTMSLFFANSSLEQAIAVHLPALSYYLTFGILFELFEIRNMINNFPALILLLSATDALSNIVELLFRPPAKAVGYETVLASVILIALARSVISVYGYVLLKQCYAFVLVQEKLKRYSELTMMIAKLKTELFYLKKSSQDIESVMERSYWLYNRLKEQEQQQAKMNPSAAKALEIARAIHEIKKDYARVIAGIEKVLGPSGSEQTMKFSEIFYIIEQNILRYIEASGKNITIKFLRQDDFKTNRQFEIVALLDNLIMNAIEACGDSGNISVMQASDDGNFTLEVIDDGLGINPEEIPFIFEPGYSTKFSPETGKMSTGLGLSHVDNLSEALGGKVQVFSSEGKGARFIVSIPQETVMSEA